jgi:hypothetical protein
MDMRVGAHDRDRYLGQVRVVRAQQRFDTAGSASSQVEGADACASRAGEEAVRAMGSRVPRRSARGTEKNLLDASSPSAFPLVVENDRHARIRPRPHAGSTGF